jgi:hypothetical protein
MAIVYWVRTKNIDSIDDGYIGVTGTNGKNKTPEDRLEEHNKTGRFCKFGTKDDLILETIFSGTDEECFAKELELRPKEQMGWNISPGGLGGNKGNSYVKTHGMPWRHKAIQTRNERLKEGKISVWSKGKKLTGHHYDVVVANRKDRLPWQYEIKNEITNEVYKCVGLMGIMEKTQKSKSSAQKISQGLRVKNCPYILVSKKSTTYKEKSSCV